MLLKLDKVLHQQQKRNLWQRNEQKAKRNSLYARQSFLFHLTLCSVQTYPVWKTDWEQAAGGRAGMENCSQSRLREFIASPSIRGLSKLWPGECPLKPQAHPGAPGLLLPQPRAARNRDELGGTVQHIKLSLCKLRASIWRGRLVFAVFLFLRNTISDLPLQHFTCWLVPILQMPLCHRGNISPEIISVAIWHSLFKLHLAVACKIVCRNHLALTKS